MSLELARHEVVQELALTNEQMREARTALVVGTDREKVTAAGEIEVLRRQSTLLVARLAEIDARSADRTSIVSWLRQTWFELKLHFESWIAHA